MQSVAVKLLVEREREIRAFIPEESWKIFAKIEGTTPMSIELSKISGKSNIFRSEASVNEFFKKHSINLDEKKITKDKKGNIVFSL